ncbi:hypothetical protein ABEU79_04885 [Geobacillus thermodenitrificans]|uniref:hypothetical protein n=1 Tax=Geobacillus thermodenitrificans TaxID=33940 RepID=UPI003D1ABE50
MKQIMKRAHELARMMEGDYVARLALGLRQAWKEAKQPKKAVLEVRRQPSGGKEWVAEIVGHHPKFKFERKFITPIARNWSSSGKTGTTSFLLEEGKIYEVNEPFHGRYFVKVENGKIIDVTVDDVIQKIA